MRRANKKPVAARPTKFVTAPVSESTQVSVVAELDVGPTPASIPVPLPDCPDAADASAIRRGQLPLKIRTRIESRLGGRVRNLVVRAYDDTVVLEGQCATYYTKQLAQHAALGILEDEHLENAIVVDGPQ
jgi:hypothetical protein